MTGEQRARPWGSGAERPRVMVLSGRAPWPAVTGDRMRAGVWVEAASAAGAETVLVAPPCTVPAEPAGFRYLSPRFSPGHLAGAAARVLRSRLPVTTLLTAAYDWPRAMAAAAAGGVDVAVVVLVRLHPWVWDGLGAPRRVLDAIDSLGGNLDERAGEARLAGPVWRLEAERTRRLEAAAARRYQRVTVVAQEDAAQIPGAEVVDHGVVIRSVDLAAPRRFDFGFWGRLAYFANADAARVLLDEVWPEVRRRRPEATLLIAGADAPAFVRRRQGRDGITVESPMADRTTLLRQVRVALFPVRFGTGQSTKVLEAAEAGCAIVATGKGVRGVREVAAAAVVAESPAALAEAAVSLASDPSTAEAAGRRARHLVERHFSRDAALRHMAGILLGD